MRDVGSEGGRSYFACSESQHRFYFHKLSQDAGNLAEASSIECRVVNLNDSHRGYPN